MAAEATAQAIVRAKLVDSPLSECSTLRVNDLVDDLVAHDYKLLDVLPLKLKLEFNKGIIMHKILFGYAPSNLKLNFVSNQNRHSHKLVVPRPRLDLFKCSLMYSGGKLWNNLPLSIKKLSDHKAFKKTFKQYLMEKITTNID